MERQPIEHVSEGRLNQIWKPRRCLDIKVFHHLLLGNKSDQKCLMQLEGIYETIGEITATSKW